MEKLANIQKTLKANKDLYNKFGGYSYRSAESILEAVKPLLDGAILMLTDEVVLIGDRYYIKASAYFEDGEFMRVSTGWAREPENKKGMDESQITGTASSYARKYALNGLFCIDDAKDADTDEHHKEVENTPKSSVDDIIKGIEEKMTLDNWKGFYKKAIGLYDKGTPEYNKWIEVFNDKKKNLESENIKNDLQSEADFVNNIGEGDITEEYYN